MAFSILTLGLKNASHNTLFVYSVLTECCDWGPIIHCIQGSLWDQGVDRHLVESDFGRFSERRDAEIARLQARVRELLERGQLDDRRLRREPVLQQVGDERVDPDVGRAKLVLRIRTGLVGQFRNSGDLHPEVADQPHDGDVDGSIGAFLQDEWLVVLDDAVRRVQRQQGVRVGVSQLLLQDLQRLTTGQELPGRCWQQQLSSSEKRRF